MKLIFKEQYRNRNAGCDEVRKYGKFIISAHYLIVGAVCDRQWPYPIYISFTNGLFCDLFRYTLLSEVNDRVEHFCVHQCIQNIIHLIFREFQCKSFHR